MKNTPESHPIVVPYLQGKIYGLAGEEPFWLAVYDFIQFAIISGSEFERRQKIENERYRIHDKSSNGQTAKEKSFLRLIFRIGQPFPFENGNKKFKIYNPILYRFLLENKGHHDIFKEYHNNGEQRFKDAYAVRLPEKRHIKTISDKYNEEFKKAIYSQNYINLIGGQATAEAVEQLSLKNGLLQAYSEYERMYEPNFRDYLAQQQGTFQDKEKQADTAAEFDTFLSGKGKLIIDDIGNIGKVASSPRDYAALIIALDNAGMLDFKTNGEDDRRLSPFHKAAKSYFNNTRIGSRENLRKYIHGEYKTSISQEAETLRSSLHEIWLAKRRASEKK